MSLKSQENCHSFQQLEMYTLPWGKLCHLKFLCLVPEILQCLVNEWIFGYGTLRVRLQGCSWTVIYGNVYIKRDTKGAHVQKTT